MQNFINDFEKLLTINSKLLIVVTEGDYEGSYDSRVEDIDAEGNILAAIPTSSGVPVPLLPSTNLAVSFMGPDTRYSFSTSVLGRVREGNVFFLKLQKPKVIEQKQLRDFFRVPTMIKTVVTFYKQPVQSGGKPIVDHTSECLIVDLSGGGCMLTTEAEGFKGQIVSVVLENILPDPGIVFGKVIRVSRFEKKFRISIEFDIDKEAKRSPIIKYVFKRQIEANCRKGDCVVGLSTSGNSKNVILAMGWRKLRFIKKQSRS